MFLREFEAKSGLKVAFLDDREKTRKNGNYRKDFRKSDRSKNGDRSGGGRNFNRQSAAQ